MKLVRVVWQAVDSLLGRTRESVVSARHSRKPDGFQGEKVRDDFHGLLDGEAAKFCSSHGKQVKR
jgi:hypothetical protein